MRRLSRLIAFCADVLRRFWHCPYLNSCWINLHSPTSLPASASSSQIYLASLFTQLINQQVIAQLVTKYRVASGSNRHVLLTINFVGDRRRVDPGIGFGLP